MFRCDLFDQAVSFFHVLFLNFLHESCEIILLDLSLNVLLRTTYIIFKHTHTFKWSIWNSWRKWKWANRKRENKSGNASLTPWKAVGYFTTRNQFLKFQPLLLSLNYKIGENGTYSFKEKDFSRFLLLLTSKIPFCQTL